MTYVAFEGSQEQSRPVEVYRFVVGAQTFRYTSADATFTFSGGPLVGETYVADAISRSNLADSAEEGEATLKVTMPGTNEVAELFKLSVPGSRVRLTLDRYQRLDTPTPEVIQVFDGFVTAVEFRDDARVAVLECRPAIFVLSRTIPRFTYQGRCNHVLYDDGCKVDNTDPAFHAQNEVVGGVADRTITVPGLGATYPDKWFDGGYVEAEGGVDFRLILSHTGDDLELLFPFAITPQVVDVFAGCDHSIQVCKSKFDNVLNYGGFAFVPNKNPHQTGL